MGKNGATNYIPSDPPVRDMLHDVIHDLADMNDFVPESALLFVGFRNGQEITYATYSTGLDDDMRLQLLSNALHQEICGE